MTVVSTIFQCFRVVSRHPCFLDVWVALVVVMSLSTGAVAKDAPRSRDQIILSFAPLVRQTGPAVVNIFAKTEVAERRTSPLFDDPFFRQFFGNMFPGQPRRRSQKSLGSGVILDPNGLIVTNHHVIANATQVKVVLSDRREFDAEVLLKDERTDLAVLRIDAGREKLPYVEIRDSDTVEVGDLVLAIGNPFGVGQTVTSGIVSALARTAIGITDYSFFIQTDASINPGNSGGALIAMDGRLIGVNTAIFSNKGGGGGSVGIGFAIPSNMVGTVLQSARDGRLIRPWLGAAGQTVTPDLAEQFGLDRPSGVIINAVFPGGPADRAGLAIGDVVVSIAGKGVDDNDALRYRIATLPIGKTAKAHVIRKGRHLALDLALDEPPAKPAADITNIDGRNPFSGARVANLSPAFALENGLDDMARGVVVLGVRRGSVADNLQLRDGDIVMEVNDKEIASVRDLTKAVRKSHKVWRIQIRRGDKVLRTEIKG
jgi:Do/DeqQ family serine protease